MAGRYRLGAQLGRGGHGVVYQATQLPLGHEVAIKMLLAEAVLTEGSVERFVREAKLAQQLTHPNTIRLMDFGQTDEGLPFIVWELLRGRTLAQAIASAPVNAERTGRIAVQVLRSLQEAHTRGIVHRDIKPENIFLTDHAGAQDFVKVLDFGVARPIDNGDGMRKITRFGQMIGTPSYMSPEQVRGEELGPGTDVYALGLVMAEAISGACIIQGDSAIRVWTWQASDDPVLLPTVVLDSPLGAVITRATRKPIAERYASCEEMLVGVERALASLVVASAAQSRPRHTARLGSAPAIQSTPPPQLVGSTPPPALAPPAPPGMSPAEPPAGQSLAPQPQPRPTITGLVLAVMVGFAIAAALAAAIVALVLREPKAPGRSIPSPPALTTAAALTRAEILATPPGSLTAMTNTDFEARLLTLGWKIEELKVSPRSEKLSLMTIRIARGAGGVGNTGQVAVYDFAEEGMARTTNTNRQTEFTGATRRDGKRVIFVSVGDDFDAADRLASALTQKPAPRTDSD